MARKYKRGADDFQKIYGLDQSGESDDATLNKLEEIHGTLAGRSLRRSNSCWSRRSCSAVNGRGKP